MRSVIVPSFLAMLAMLAAAVLAPASRAAPTSPAGRNIVLIVADDHGLDLGCWGSPDARTPHLDRLAADGVRFTHAFCTTASCSASRSVILTGLHNHANGQYGHQHGPHHFATFTSVKSLPVLLAAAGYRTAQAGKLHVAPESVYHFESYLGGNPGGPRNPVGLADLCRELFAAKDERPFFLYFCPTDPHRSGSVPPGDPLRPDAFGNGPRHADTEVVTFDPAKLTVPAFLPDTPACRAELAQYYQSVARLDQGVGRLVRHLRETGQYERTLIVYLSDNGMAFPGSKTTLYEPGMHLPLIVRAPGGARGQTSGALVSWADLTPTLLDFAGVKEVAGPPAHPDAGEGLPARRVGQPGKPGKPAKPGQPAKPAAPYRFHGRSFLPMLAGGTPEGWDEVYGSHTFHEITMYYPMRVVRTRTHKLILNLAHPLPFPFASDLEESATWRSRPMGEDALYGRRKVRDFLHRPRWELYDLEKDPDEVRNLAGDPACARVLADLQARLKAFQERTADPWVVKYRYE